MSEKEDEALMKRMAELPKDAQEHFKMVVRLVALCYVDPEKYSGLLLVNGEDDGLVMMSLNANDMDAAELLVEASEYIHQIVTHDAPPKEQFN